jgi:Tfp pilus assembly protein PilP
MNRGRRLAFWTTGILGLVCLLLLNLLVWRFRQEQARRLVAADLARSVSVAAHPAASSQKHYEPPRVQGGASATAARRSGLQSAARAARNPLESELAKPTVLLHFPEAKSQAVAPPEPQTTTLEPLGYVEKGDGRVEAIISLGDRVQVVHQGEILEDKFRVAKISSSSVELIENSVATAEAQLTAEVGKDAVPVLPGEAQQTVSSRILKQVSNTGEVRQFDADSAISGSQPSVRQELGYVERGDGRVESIIAEGEQVHLAPASKSFASDFRAPSPSPTSVEVANVSPPAINPPDSLGLESQPVQADSPTQEVGEPPLTASGIETSALDQRQEIPGTNGESNSEQFDVSEPEPLADYAGNRLGASVPQSVMPALPALEPSPLSDRSGNQSAVRTLGYVEKAGGEKVAIVEVLDQVYLVREGELFAEKFRALHVTPSSVEIVDESPRGSSAPAEAERDIEAVGPPISWWRGPPLLTGSSGTDPPAEVRKVEEFVAGEPAVSPSRPPPERPREWLQETRRVKTLKAASGTLHLVGQSAQNDTRSPPHAAEAVGIVEKANGETEVIMADQGGVYLVPQGGVSPGNAKILNPVPAEAQSSWESLTKVLQRPAKVIGGPLPVEKHATTWLNPQELSPASSPLSRE